MVSKDERADPSDTSLTARSKDGGISKRNSSGRECDEDTTNALCSFSQIGAVVPRRKFDVDMFSKHIVLRGTSVTSTVAHSDIDELFILSGPNKAMVSVLISLKNPLKIGKQRFPHVVFKFSRRRQVAIEYDEVVTEGSEWRLFADALKRSSGKDPHEPSPGIEPISVTKGVDNGELFFFDSWIVFGNKPPTCVAYETISSVTLHRIRYGSMFDIILTVAAGQGRKERAISFRNVDNGVFDKVETFLKQSAGLQVNKEVTRLGID